jgi:hypothetical protein
MLSLWKEVNFERVRVTLSLVACVAQGFDGDWSTGIAKAK